MIPLPFDAIQWSDIMALVTDGCREDRALEYKQELPDMSDDEEKEFLADASALANTAGGDLIYGVGEERDEHGKATGIPASLAGVTVSNSDAELRRLENLLRDSVEPRMLGVRMRMLEGPDGIRILLIRVQASLIGPHVVRFKNHWRFYGRNSAGKHPFDLGETRAAFAASDELPERLHRFRAERFARIAGDETPVLLAPQPKMVLHLILLAPVTRTCVLGHTGA